MYHFEQLFLFALTVSGRCVQQIHLSPVQASNNGTGASSTPVSSSPISSVSQAPLSTGNAASTSSVSTTSTTIGSKPVTNPTVSASSTPQSPRTGASGCPPMMKGVVFNGGMNPGMFDTIAAADDWLTFQPTIPNGPASSKASAGFVPMMAFASHVPDAISIVNGANPPPWMLTFNEPDYSYGSTPSSPGTPTMSPQEAASAIAPLISQPGKSTKFVAPATADPASDWLDQFYAACNCKDFFSAYNIHQYHPDSATVISNINTFHAKYPDKPLWVTEVAPGSASPACSLSWDAVASFMKDIYSFAAKSGFVDRVFWNTGNQIGPGDTNVCNSYLINHMGSPSPLLAAYAGIDCS